MSASYVIGKAVPLTYTILVGGVATNATVALTITLPDGTTSAPSVSNPSTGTYTASITASQNGLHVARWVATGAVIDAEEKPFTVGGLVSLAEVKKQLGKGSATTDDAELQDYIDAVTASVEMMCGTVAPTIVTDEVHHPTGSRLFLRSERVASITTVTGYSGVTPLTFTAVTSPVAASTYTYLREGTMLTRLSAGGGSLAWPCPVYVTYTAGFSTVPPALNLAARLIVQHLWRTQNGGAGLPSLTDEQTSDNPYFDAPIPARAEMLMAPYRRSPMVG